ncbi:MAG: proline--tRNA ligase [Polyangiaceae bacterium]|nr:proline--tRNA ligase [Polyangiaceae bacterium]
MRFTQALIRTSKEAPADASGTSHVLLTRAGMIRKVGAGIYDYLPLGLRVLRKIEGIVRAEMSAAGALEVLLPALLPAEYFQETGRYTGFGDTLLRLKDRKGAEYHLGPTHEEIITDLVRREVKSYRELPLNLYQVQTKFRDEARPRAGLLRCREFLMKDAYSFDVDEAGAKASYEKMRVAYNRIFTRLGLDYRMVSADSGAMGGSTSAEFQVLTQSGEDAIAVSDGSDYAANLEVAAAADPRASPPAREAPLARERVHTPGHGTIEDIARFLKTEPSRFLKSLVYLAVRAEASADPERHGGVETVMVVVRGDHEVNEIKLARALGAAEVFLANPQAVEDATGARVGFAGPVGFKGKIIVDRDAAVVARGVTGANETDHHLVNVEHGRDYDGEVADVRNVVDGDASPDGAGRLKIYRGIEAGHIFILGTHYSAKMGATYLGEDGLAHPIVMGCYGIGVSRLVATAVEQHHDEDGISWPMPIAPYHVHLVTLGMDEAILAAGRTLEAELVAKGVEVLWDDRDERPGVKFKDADLLGVPLRVTLGGKGLASGVVELKRRSDRSKAFDALPIATAADEIARRVREALG